MAYTVSQLAAATRTPLATIKFYLRERLLPRPDLGQPRRAFYGEAHVERLRLIRALREVGGLGVAAVRDVCRSLDDDRARVADVIPKTIDAVGRHAKSTAVTAEARGEVKRFLAKKRVRVRPRARAVGDLAASLVVLRAAIGPEVAAPVFGPYLDAMRALAERDFEENAHLVTSKTRGAYAATLAVVLWEPILLVLRRIAFEDVCARRFGGAR